MSIGNSLMIVPVFLSVNVTIAFAESTLASSKIGASILSLDFNLNRFSFSSFDNLNNSLGDSSGFAKS